MKKLFLLFACTTALAVFLNVPSASAQGKLEGVWKATEITFTGPSASTTTNVEPVFVIITKKYVSQIGLQGPQPDLP